MTLKDFFTLNELENGLTTHDRVGKLITVMQSEKDSTLNNFGQTAQLWLTVANTIAATENKDCLDLFIQLDGLFFFDKWLKDAQKLENNNENDFFDELIISLLRALERLQIDSQRLSTSEIGKTVQDLVAHSSSIVCVKVKELCDSWKLNIAPKEVENLDHVECRPPDIVMDSEPKDQELLDHVDPSCKSADDNDRDSNSKSEGVGTLSSTLEQIASSADVDNPLESAVKTDTSGDKDDDMADDSESPKMSSNSDNNIENVSVQINEKSEIGSHFFKLSTDSKTSDMKLDYGMIDPLDIARQVAIEVEQDVDSRERSCSTSDKTQDGEIEKPTTSDSRNFQEIQSQSQSQSRPVGGSDKEVLPEPMKDAETLVSQISEVAQVSEPDTGRGFRFSGFDLNQEVCSEEVDNPVNPVSSTISVVSASRAAAAAQVPTGPLQFEGAIGWKGCASTSAFQAVPVLEGSGTGTRTHNNSQQLLGFHDFDLNVAEDGDEDKTVMISYLPSGEESSVANPKRPKRVQLDLNSIGDDQNGGLSPYHASSSSSSSKQPIIRNIDLNLNDQPVLPNGEASVVSIFGAKLEVKREDYVPQLEPKLDFNLGRPLESSSMQYDHTNPSFYCHHQNGMFFSLPLYGSSSSASHGMPMPMPMPYMVDSRGTPYVPQIIGSQPPPPFIMNMAVAGAPSGSSGAGSLQHNFGMNMGLMVNGGLRQFFPHNGNEQASASSVLGKRHEPDSNWEFFPHQQPPWR